ncbi:MAG: phosphoribosylamine--glycine ligase [Rickettsiales bacterium]|nr:phosphoribosylamine--glycine ligase [Rickettsiales bacterium]
MKILVIGSGGREHSLVWSIAASPLCEKIFCAPGNAGVSDLAECVKIKAKDTKKIIAFCKKRKIDLVIVGPEDPLANGLIDNLESKRIRAFGPVAAAAKLEGSKGFMKDFCKKYKIPTAKYQRFNNTEKAVKGIDNYSFPVVIKTDGLASGKGVIIAKTPREASAAIRSMIDKGKFGNAGKEIIIEEFMRGEEASFFVMSDGKNIIPLASAQDHKRIGEGETGPNTGGMGAYSPAPIIDESLTQKILNRIIWPTINGMQKEGSPYVGILYAGLMIKNNQPKLVEFNVRFGDPECQAILLRLKSDLLTAIIAATDKGLKNFDLRWSEDSSFCVVMAAKGYPKKYKGGAKITGIAKLNNKKDIMVFHSGTKKEKQDTVTNGGRVLSVAALGKDLMTAKKKTYQAIKNIKWKDMYYRRDIGWRLKKN